MVLVVGAVVRGGSASGVRGAGVREAAVDSAQNATTRVLAEAQFSAGQEAWMGEFCASKCQAPWYCCNDHTIGSNQMISCAQACMMRARGSSFQELASAGSGLCNRNGGSGCSLEVNGHPYGFCSTCQDLTSSPQCHWGVSSSAACDYGASLVPAPEDYCFFSCKAAGYCCNDYRVGSNQMISCAQACMMRTLGASWSAIATTHGGICDRNGGSGCSLDVGGRQYSFCSSCADLTGTSQCQWGVASSAACDFGASLPPSHWGWKA
jgi:hypothetical protein